MDEQLKLAHSVVDVVVHLNRKIWVTRLRYNVDHPECSYAQVRILPRTKEEQKIQQTVYVN